jgi:hypothetical protein
MVRNERSFRFTSISCNLSTVFSGIMLPAAEAGVGEAKSGYHRLLIGIERDAVNTASRRRLPPALAVMVLLE